jgi:peptidyl-tRNA hydrolase
MIRLTNIKVGIKKAANYDSERKALRNIILSKLRINEKELINYTIFKKSIDAIRKAIIE